MEDDAEALRKFVAEARDLLTCSDAVDGHSSFEIWDERVGKWLDKRSPELAAEWSALGSSNLIVGGAYYQDPAVWVAFKRVVQARLQWLSQLPQRLESTRRLENGPRTASALAVPWSVLRSVLYDHFSFTDIKVVAGLSGIDVTALAGLEQRQERGATKSQLLSAIDGLVAAMSEVERERFVRATTEEVLRRRPGLDDALGDYLRRVGWTLQDGNVIPLVVLDVSELRELPEECRADLTKAAVRLRDGDLGGALTAACGAVDAVTAKIYGRAGLGKPGDASFQERVGKSVKEVGVLGRVESDLTSLGWNAHEAKRLAQNLAAALNHAAFVMQSLRSGMADVHGTRPALRPLVFDSLKWAALIVRLLETE